MLNVQKQIDYWIQGADDDLITARILIESNRLLHGLFFCHLVIEKSIKAVLVNTTKEMAPRSHNLVYLSEQAQVKLEDKDELFLGILMKYQLEGRYPDYNPNIPPKEKVSQYLEQTKELHLWLKAKLLNY